jgi:hypothetical protein
MLLLGMDDNVDMFIDMHVQRNLFWKTAFERAELPQVATRAVGTIRSNQMNLRTFARLMTFHAVAE